MHRDELKLIVAGYRHEHGGDGLDRQGRIHLAHAVGRILSFLPTDAKCLVRSLVLLRLLERRGVASTLVIGVRSEPEFAAHAWVEYEGEALLPTGGGQYARMVEI